MELEFRKVTDFKQGTLHKLLVDGYSFDSRFEERYGADWVEFDQFFYDNPEIADKYGFITVLDGEPIGLVSWDPRNMPDYVEVGHNCISARYKGKGYGSQEMKEAVRRIKEYEGLKKIIVSTSNSLLPAQRNYESAGFQLVQKRENDRDNFAGETLDYQIVL